MSQECLYGESKSQEVFSKLYESTRSQYEHFLPLLPSLEQLSRTGAVPKLFAFVLEDKNTTLHMESVSGFALDEMPAKYECLRFSPGLARSVAELLKEIESAGLYHDDFHIGNVMFDIVKRRCVAVDLDSFTTTESLGIENPVSDFAEALFDLYTSINGFDWKGEADIYESGAPLTLQELRALDERGNPISDTVVASKVFEEQGLNQRIHPAIKDFILRSLNPETRPENLDEMLAL